MNFCTFAAQANPLLLPTFPVAKGIYWPSTIARIRRNQLYNWTKIQTENYLKRESEKMTAENCQQLHHQHQHQQMPKCLVCSARNAKQHYGSWCCNGCKGFFWRTVSSKRRYICLNSTGGCSAALAKCEIQDGRRNSCRACRLKRCLEVGMDPNLIRDSWGKSTALKKRNCEDDQVQIQPRSSMELNTMVGAAETDQQQKAEEMEWREVSPSNSVHSQSSSTGSHNSPAPSSTTASLSSSNSRNAQSNVQLLTDYLQWMQTISELKLFSEQDKNLLVLNRARPCGWLILADHHLFSPQKLTTHRELALNKLEVLHAEIVGPFRELGATKLEFELLRLVSFFSVVPQLSAEGKKMVQHIQDSYSRSLSEFSLNQALMSAAGTRTAAATAQQQQCSLLSNTVHRVSRIVQLLAVVEKIAHQYD